MANSKKGVENLSTLHYPLSTYPPQKKSPLYRKGVWGIGNTLNCVVLALYNSLLQHCLCNLQEACDICTLNIVDAVALCASLNASLVD